MGIFCHGGFLIWVIFQLIQTFVHFSNMRFSVKGDFLLGDFSLGGFSDQPQKKGNFVLFTPPRGRNILKQFSLLRHTIDCVWFGCHFYFINQQKRRAVKEKKEKKGEVLKTTNAKLLRSNFALKSFVNNKKRLKVGGRKKRCETSFRPGVASEVCVNHE